MANYNNAELRAFREWLRLPPEPIAEILTPVIRDAVQLLVQVREEASHSTQSTHGPHDARRVESLADPLMRRGHSSELVKWAVYKLIERGLVEGEFLEDPLRPGVYTPLVFLHDVVSGQDTKVVPNDEMIPAPTPRRFTYLQIRPTAELLDSWQKANQELIFGNPILETAKHSTWPNREGWDFQAGEAAYNGKVFQIVGKEALALQHFVASKGKAVTVGDLRNAVWDGDAETEDDTIRSVVSTTRKAIRAGLGLDQTYDPLPSAGRGTRAYKLALS